jgi:hypothetical protein
MLLTKSSEVPGFIKPKLATLIPERPRASSGCMKSSRRLPRPDSPEQRKAKGLYPQRFQDERFSVIAGALDIPGQRQSNRRPRRPDEFFGATG